MSRGRGMCETLHLLALGLWLGALVMTGATAAIIFPTMRTLDPSLPGFPGAPDDQWMLAAGTVMQRVFFVCDAVQLGAAVVAAATLILLVSFFGLTLRRPSAVVRTALLLGVLTALAYYLVSLSPQMTHNLREYWDAAKAGDTAKAATFKAAFDADHPRASALLGANTFGVLVAFIAAAWCAATPDGVGASGTGGGVRPRRPSELEPPALLRGPR